MAWAVLRNARLGGVGFLGTLAWGEAGLVKYFSKTEVKLGLARPRRCLPRTLAAAMPSLSSICDQIVLCLMPLELLHKHSYTHTHAHTRTHTHTHTHSYQHTLKRPHTHAHTHTHIQYSYLLRHTHSYLLTYLHTHTHTQTHSHTHTHRDINMLPTGCCGTLICK